MKGFNLILMNDLEFAEVNFKLEHFDLVLRGFRVSVMDGFDLYNKLHDSSKKVKGTPKEFRIISSIINFKC